MRNFFTSESVTEGHPDKICDRVSDSILDAILAQDKTARVACETVATTGMVMVVGEITTNCTYNIPEIVRVNKNISELCDIYDNYIADICGFSETSKYLVNHINWQAKILANEKVYGISIALDNISNCINSDITFRCIFGKIISDKNHPFCRFLTNFVKL